MEQISKRDKQMGSDKEHSYIDSTSVVTTREFSHFYDVLGAKIGRRSLLTAF